VRAVDGADAFASVKVGASCLCNEDSSLDEAELPKACSTSSTLTWDQGHEMAEHARFTQETGIDVYFCDPKSPWQRGDNENTNGLLRQYLPRTLDFRTLTQDDFDAIADEVNGRPRQTLNFKTPSQALAEVLR
jgi:IS30 family transposase